MYIIIAYATIHFQRYIYCNGHIQSVPTAMFQKMREREKKMTTQ